MTAKLKIAVLIVGLTFAASAFADTYQYTVTFNANPAFQAGQIKFNSTSLQPSFDVTSGFTVVYAPPGWFLAELFLVPDSPSTSAHVSALWELITNHNVFNDVILYNNVHGDWALGLQNVTGNSSIANNDSGTIDVVDLTTTATPEPGSLALLGSGLVGLAGAIRKKMVA